MACWDIATLKNAVPSIRIVIGLSPSDMHCTSDKNAQNAHEMEEHLLWFDKV